MMTMIWMTSKCKCTVIKFISVCTFFSNNEESSWNITCSLEWCNCIGAFAEFRQVSLGTFLLITIYMWGSVCYCYSPKKCDLPRGISCNCVLVFIHLCHTCTSCFLFRFVSDFDLMIQKKKEVHTNLQSLWLLKGTYFKMFCFFSVISSDVASCK